MSVKSGEDSCNAFTTSTPPSENHLEVLVLLPSHKKEKKLLTLYIHTTHKPPCCISKANLTCNKVIIMAQKSCQVGREKKKNPSNSPTICRILGIYYYNDDDMQLFGNDKVRKRCMENIWYCSSSMLPTLLLIFVIYRRKH